MSSLGVGVIEGFFGTPWSWEDRARSAERLQQLGGRFYVYAPKGDPYLRKEWFERLPDDTSAQLRELGQDLHRRGLSFGVGLSPYELYRQFDDSARSRLGSKLEEIHALGADHLALLFDDMRGDIPDLARLQVSILAFVRSLGLFRELSFCPTYYTTDPILDRVFGQRPDGYLEQLRDGVDPSVHFYWTGEKVCSTEYPLDHLRQVEQWMGRKPLLWDNYPVNDGHRMCRFLHLREMKGRPQGLLGELSGHAINPMNQATLSWISIRTLMQCYAGQSMDWMAAARAELGAELAERLSMDAAKFQDEGLDRFMEQEKETWIAQYLRFDHPAAREVVAWLRDETRVTRELVLTQ